MFWVLLYAAYLARGRKIKGHYYGSPQVLDKYFTSRQEFEPLFTFPENITMLSGGDHGDELNKSIQLLGRGNGFLY